MNFIEATSSGKNFRHPDMKEGCYFGFKDDELREFFHDGGNSFPRFASGDFFRDDWEFVLEPVVIEVGDVVEYCGISEILKARGKEKVIFVGSDDVWTLPEGRSPHCYKKHLLSLIRKGNVHTFEGVVIGYRGNGWAIPILPSLDSLKGKTYTIIVKEENDG